MFKLSPDIILIFITFRLLYTLFLFTFLLIFIIFNIIMYIYPEISGWTVIICWHLFGNCTTLFMYLHNTLNKLQHRILASFKYYSSFAFFWPNIVIGYWLQEFMRWFVSRILSNHSSIFRTKIQLKEKKCKEIK